MLSDEDIKKERNRGHVVIEPFDETLLNANSYDIRLGNEYYASDDTTRIPQKVTDLPLHVPNPHANQKMFTKTEHTQNETRYVTHYLCPWSQDSIDQFWSKPKKAIRLESKEDLLQYQLPNHFLHREIIIVPPMSTILGHTIEFIGGQHNITTMMEAKSSIGRCNITVCRCAGLGDVGFINRWCMEIQNCCRYTSLILVVGERIGQITFHYVQTPPSRTYGKRGRYQEDYQEKHPEKCQEDPNIQERTNTNHEKEKTIQEKEDKKKQVKDIIQNWKIHDIVPKAIPFYS